MTLRRQLARRFLGPPREHARPVGWFVLMATATIVLVGFAMTLHGWFLPVAWLAAVIFLAGLLAEGVRAARLTDRRRKT